MLEAKLQQMHKNLIIVITIQNQKVDFKQISAILIVVQQHK